MTKLFEGRNPGIIPKYFWNWNGL